MVAVLLRLRFRVLANTLGRNALQLVAVILGGMSTVMALAVVFALMVVASGAPPAATQAVVVVGGAALVLGWFIVPLLFDGVDHTLDPLKLARFPLRPGQLMTATILVGALWVPGVATIIASVGTVVAWHAHPVAAVAAGLTGLVGAATAIAGSRLTTSVAGTLSSGRAASRIATAAFVILVAAGPLAGATLGAGTILTNFTAVVAVIGWTPFGAVWSIPGRLAMGDLAGAAGASGIALGTLAVVFVLWRLTFESGARGHRSSPKDVGVRGSLGPLGWFPSTPTGAIAARSLIYWFRDPRQAKQMILIPVLPALMLVWWRLLGFEGLAFAAGPAVATILPLSTFAGLSYDGTAFAAQLVAGVRGFHDRLGRAGALLVIAVPAGVIIQVAVAVIIGAVSDLPALLGLSIGTALISSGVVSVSSARVVVPVARSGRNPFSAQPGAATVSIAASYAVTGVTIALALPLLALAIPALVTGSTLLGWLSLAVGLVLGAGVAFGGILLGGRILDASAPAVLARLRLIRA